MTEEEKKVQETKQCDCCKKAQEFFFIAGAVFLGTLLALLLAHALNKPQFPPCHRGMMGPHHPRMERQLPQQAFSRHGQRPNFRGQIPQQRGDFRGPRGMHPQYVKGDVRLIGRPQMSDIPQQRPNLPLAKPSK